MKQTRVETGSVEGRRSLHFESFDEVLAEARRLGSGDHRALGNWSLGQAPWHMGQAMFASAGDFGMGNGGIPLRHRILGRLFIRSGMIRRRFPAGIRLPRPMAVVLE
ncbi:MAG: DUF1569 domain-containing protein, partial [Pirellulales bacterium]